MNNVKVVASVVELAKRYGWQEDDPRGINDWLEERLAGNERMEATLHTEFTLQQLCVQHGCQATTWNACYDWLDTRLSLLEEHEAILKVATADIPDVYGASRLEPNKPGLFARHLREQQLMSASQAMVLLAAKLQQALEENAALKEELDERWAIEQPRALKHES